MNVLEIAKELIRRPSVTPVDADCQRFIADFLASLGFRNRHLPIENVDNLWSVHGEGSPVFCFLGHTDVVPTGCPSTWQHPPFEPSEADGNLYGRGAADMKGCIAAFLQAAKEFVLDHPTHKGSLAILLTSDEEGVAVNGIRAVMDVFRCESLKIDYCLVGEPSSEARLGDTIKVGRRGSLSGHLVVKGIQGHIAYPELACNPIHDSLPALVKLAEMSWDAGNQYFPASSFQISNFNSGTGADNVIPGQADILFNFRFSTELEPEAIRKKVHSILDAHNLDYNINWRLSGLPFLTQSGRLVDAAQEAIRRVTGVVTRCTTHGGTSDGRFVAPFGAEVVEVGLVNRTIHKVNEHVSIADLEQLSLIYKQILELLLGGHQD